MDAVRQETGTPEAGYCQAGVPVSEERAGKGTPSRRSVASSKKEGAMLMDFEELDQMQMASDIAEELYRRRKLREQWNIEMAERWNRMVANTSSEAPTFRHPDEVQS